MQKHALARHQSLCKMIPTDHLQPLLSSNDSPPLTRSKCRTPIIEEPVDILQGLKRKKSNFSSNLSTLQRMLEEPTRSKFREPMRSRADLTKRLGEIQFESIDEEEAEMSECDPVQYRSLMEVRRDIRKATKHI